MSERKPGAYDVDRIERRIAAHKAFSEGASISEAASMYAITTTEVEDMIRMDFSSNMAVLADHIALELDRTHHEDVALIETWLRVTMIAVLTPEADFVDAARQTIAFPPR